ncbi:FG-GAP repeat domain-containing protein [Propionibacteriaceae bacterium Y1923]|uniref:FG-GAP repeat domain-containing protein n=1 Tax=Aestuariimicrobium sp. Y1814 TaxID=3418742 RepID=UPI003C285106
MLLTSLRDRRPGRSSILRLFTSVTLTLAVMCGLTITAPAQARAAVPQPGQVPFMNFGGVKTWAGVTLRVDYPEREGSNWRIWVSVCNSTGSPLPVGPHAFSYTNQDYLTWYFEAGWHGALSDQVLQNNGCASGFLKSNESPWQMAFHKVFTVDQRIDILPATEWEAIAKVSEPRSWTNSGRFGDLNGDLVADLMASTGTTLHTFSTTLPNQTPQLLLTQSTTTRWTWMSKVPDQDRNGVSDLLVRKADGTMSFIRMMEFGRLGFENRVGTGWNGITLMGVVPKEGDSHLHPWLVARAANGDLIRYQVSAQGIYSASKIGKNWNSIRHLFSVGDFSGDGIPDLMAIGTNGLLYRYNMTATGGISSVNVVGRGWGNFTTAVSAGDLNRDGFWDMVGIRNDGNVYVYFKLGPGRWGAGRLVASNWSRFELFA